MIQQQVEAPTHQRTRYFASRYSVHPDTILAWARLKKIPPPLRPSPRLALWPVAETCRAIEALLQGGR